MPTRDPDRIAANIDLRVQQLAAQGITGKALVDPMLGYWNDLQWIYETVSDDVLFDLVRRYPRFETFAAVMEDFSRVNRELLANGTHPAQNLIPVHDRLRKAVFALARRGGDLEREYQSSVDAGALDQARHFATLRRDWLCDFDAFMADLHASGESQQMQSYIEQELGILANSIRRIPG